MHTPLLVTKFHLPILRKDIVPRRRLVECQIARFNANSDKKLTLVSAPAGYGKTTFVREWISACLLANGDDGSTSNKPITAEPKFAWLSLEESDNDPQRFLGYLLASLRQVDAGIGRVAEAMLQAPQPPPGDAILTTLVNDLAAVSQPFSLILDDYHLIHAPPIHQQLNFLLEHQPPQMHLVVITREDPPLPLARLRVRGQMLEIRQDDLRFSLEECADFLNQAMGLNLPPDDIAALERRTEGWIAGLQLAALSMRGSRDLSGFIEAFTGSSHYVLDYLIEEVFMQQPADVQDFLLKTSILERLSGPLCDAVVHRTGSRDLLERLEHANLFIIPLDQSCTWYRYHHLFADLLRQRLQTAGMVPKQELHKSASRWFQAEGFFPEAIQHSLAAADWDQAAHLIESQSVILLRRGELITLLGWFKSLPEDVLRTRPNLFRDYGWALALTGQFDAAAPILDCAERALQGNQEQLGQIMVAQAYLARARGDYPRAIAISRQALEFVPAGDILHRSLVTFTLGFALFNTGQFAEAEPVLLEACEAARASGNDYARLTALGLLGAIHKLQGRLHRGAAFCQQAMQEAHGSPAAAQTQVFLASILYEWNDLEAASDQLEKALKASQSIGNQAIQPEIYRIQAQIHQARGNFAAAPEMRQEFHQLTQELARDFESPVARAQLAALNTDIALAQGDIPSASHWVQQMMEGVDPAALSIQYGLNQARLCLAKKQAAEAGKLLEGLYESVSKTGMVSILIEIRAMQSLAATSPNEAIGYLIEALQMAQPENFVRTFVDKGKPMQALLERLKLQGGDMKPYILTLLAAFGETGHANQSQPMAGPELQRAKGLIVETLSEREIEILRLLAEGLSNQEIATRLVIGVGTAKSHVHHILEKLGGSSRSQAVAKARERGLL